jgi:hypothetical protein
MKIFFYIKICKHGDDIKLSDYAYMWKVSDFGNLNFRRYAKKYINDTL